MARWHAGEIRRGYGRSVCPGAFWRAPRGSAGASRGAGVPAMPVILPASRCRVTRIRWSRASTRRSGGISGRQPRAAAQRIRAMRRTGLGSLKVIGTFPLTDDGWASAWQSLVGQNPAAAAEVGQGTFEPGGRCRRQAEPPRAISRGEQATEAGRWCGSARWHTSEGMFPGSAIRPGERYDVRFLEDRLMVFACRQAEVLAEVPYSQVEDVDIGGPGLVKFRRRIRRRRVRRARRNRGHGHRRRAERADHADLHHDDRADPGDRL